jgi:hypothetical protein
MLNIKAGKYKLQFFCKNLTLYYILIIYFKINNIEESPLEVATRWHHINVIKILLERKGISSNNLRKSYIIADNDEIKKLIKIYIKN